MAVQKSGYARGQPMQIKSFSPGRVASPPVQITKTEGEPLDPVVTPDGKTVIFAAGKSRPLTRELHRVGIDGEDQVQLTDRVVNYSWHPSISPDGEKIAYVVEKEGKSDLQVMNLDGSGNINLTDTNKGHWYPSWSADGKWIATTSRDTRGGNLEIVVVAADGSEKTQVTDLGLNTDMPTFAPDGAHIVFGLAPGFGAPILSSIKRDGTGFRTYANDLVLMSQPTVAEDGRIAFSASARNGRTGIYQVQLNSDEQAELIVDTETAFSPQYSPDGKHLVFSASTDSGMQIFEANSDGTEPRALTQGEGFKSAPSYVGDGQAVVYTSYQDGEKEVYRVDLK